ncbi:MAG: CopG family transcriptional regulator [candidate division NC10 bacterium]|nr:CopG family transcriptional regulator [candidate division NC10 bacterium]
MRTVQLTLDEELVDAVDRMAKKLGTTRSGFAREALRVALARSKERAMERQHREGYLRKPPKRGEFQIWEKEQIWGEP